MKKVSEVTVVPVKPKFGLIAFASFVLFESFYVTGVAVYTRPMGGIRLVYPRRKNVDTCYPILKDLGQEIQDAVADYIQRYELMT
ncbi:MAG: septation protein SpoVG family protein [Candidatus Nomurabacteria bacterium]|nr:MAG: septation protein SpoVG family protein [Candidatus Nomurabacteria bacterium]